MFFLAVLATLAANDADGTLYISIVENVVDGCEKRQNTYSAKLCAATIIRAAFSLPLHTLSPPPTAVLSALSIACQNLGQSIFAIPVGELTQMFVQ